MSRIAVIFGGHGFIGSHLARRLASSGNYKRVISADIAAEPRFRSEGVEYVRCDIREPIPCDLVPAATEIYNLAAVHTTPGHDDWEYFWTNVLGASHVCDFARQVGVRVIVFTSSISVYGSSEESRTESTEPKPNTAYGRSKFCAEAIHKQWYAEAIGDRRLIIVRPAVIFGYKESGNFTRLAKLLSKNAFIYPGRKETIKACGYVKDLVESVLYALEGADSMITYNFAYPDSYTTEDICRAFCNVAGYHEPFLVVPIWLMMGIGRGFESLTNIGFRTSINRARILKLFRSTNIRPVDLNGRGFKWAYDLESALLDWKNCSEGGHFE
jgi:nucleoside-diphosphate-sugar epimerase